VWEWDNEHALYKEGDTGGAKVVGGGEEGEVCLSVMERTVTISVFKHWGEGNAVSCAAVGCHFTSGNDVGVWVGLDGLSKLVGGWEMEEVG